MSERGLTMNRQSKQMICKSLLVVVVLLLVSSASAFAWVRVGVNVGFAPPPFPVAHEFIGPRPGAAYAWVGGHYGWYPSLHRYNWVRGAWLVPPYRGAVWAHPHYDGRFFVGGHWRR
jgi:hypothetical protein